MAQLAAFFESAFFASYPSGCTGNLGVCSSFLPLPKARARIARRRSVCLVEETIGNYLEKSSAHGSAERAGTMTNGVVLVNRNHPVLENVPPARARSRRYPIDSAG